MFRRLRKIIGLSGRYVLAAGFIALIIYGFIDREIQSKKPYGEELIKKHSERYVLLGEHIVTTSVGVNLNRDVPALFIYFLQSRSKPNMYLVIVAQSRGYSVDLVEIGGSAINTPITFRGDGKYWGKTITSNFNVPDKSYEQYVVIFNPTDGVVEVTVSYCGISSARGRFSTWWGDTEASFALRPK